MVSASLHICFHSSGFNRMPFLPGSTLPSFSYVSLRSTDGLPFMNVLIAARFRPPKSTSPMVLLLPAPLAAVAAAGLLATALLVSAAAIVAAGSATASKSVLAAAAAGAGAAPPSSLFSCGTAVLTSCLYWSADKLMPFLPGHCSPSFS
eukprot:GHRR01012855.1.p2 GENE.GHRR01012855.1~~GHRR01012855.1.p2  ORF type:complete len:149 (-),score=45.61 GHRR01012855.1:1344-1790(-)